MPAAQAYLRPPAGFEDRPQWPSDEQEAAERLGILGSTEIDFFNVVFDFFNCAVENEPRSQASGVEMTDDRRDLKKLSRG